MPAVEVRRTFWTCTKYIIMIVIALRVLTTAMAMIFALSHFNEPPPPNTCTTPTCLQEAVFIERQVDFAENPCHNFYQYACGNFKEDTHRISALMQGVFYQFIDLYNQPIQKDDHKMIKSMKKLYKACLTEIGSDKLAIHTDKIKKTLSLVGGWPVLEGSKWDNSKFDWLEATYKFREVGLNFSVFLDLSVMIDPRNESKHILKVSLPTQSLIQKSVMIEVAIALGADKESAESEINDAHMLMEYLFENGVHMYTLNTIEGYQQSQKFKINWLSFINKIASPVLKLSKEDFVVFTQPEDMVKRLDLLWSVRKRVLANYMVWRALVEIVPNLIDDFQNKHERPFTYGQLLIDKQGSCFDKIQERFQFVPNPIDILYIRKYLPNQKLQLVNELITNIRAEFFETFDKAKWMDPKDKRNIVRILEAVPMVVGAPENYFNEKILDELDVDMEETDTDSFMRFLLRINRNYHSFMYKKVTLPVNETRSFDWNLYQKTNILNAVELSDTIELPATILQAPLFEPNRPNYLNYGALGSFAAVQLVNQFTKLLRGCPCNGYIIAWSIKSQQGFEEIQQCLHKRSSALKIVGAVIVNLDMITLRHQLGPNISYTAYKKWEKNHGVEPRLANIPATNEQLFWIAAAVGSCQPLQILNSPLLRTFSTYILYLLGGNYVNFAKDFNCPEGSVMNPIDKCDIF